MSDKRPSRRRRDRNRRRGGEAYAVTQDRAERIIKRAGGSRKRADALCVLIEKHFLAA